MAASVGLEPTTITLTACSSTIELWGNAIPQVSIELTASCSSHKHSTNWAIGGKRRRRDLNPRRVLSRSFLAGKRHKPLGHLSSMSENGGIWTPKSSAAQTELLSDYNTFSRSQLHIKYSCEWVGLESNQQSFKLLFYRQLLIPIWEPTQGWKFGRSPRNWTSIHPLKRRLQNHSANDPQTVLTGVEPANHLGENQAA